MKNIFLFLLLASLGQAFPTSASAETCVSGTCHAQIASLGMPHQPVKDGDCGSCHIRKESDHPIKGKKSFELAAKGGALCAQCHEATGKKKVVHPPAKDGDCTACHNPHGGSQRYLMDIGDNLTELCTGCHDPAPFRQKMMHGPTAIGACTKCHDPHESSEKNLLRSGPRDLCLKCHADFKKALDESPVVHPPVKTSCTSCHNPHGTAGAVLLRKQMPDLCIECHKEMGKKLAAVKVPHKPLTSAKGCGSCHSTHYSQGKGLLPADEKTVCLGCHGVDKVGSLSNIKKDIEGKKYLHGPLQKGLCSPCHDPHGSGNFRLLTGNYPESIYTPYTDTTYLFCLQCHEKNLLRFSETTIYTKFRNGDKNLHYLHIVSRKGRTCRVCHDPHAADAPKLIRKDGAAFGDWKLPLNFTLTETGGSCAPGCHKMLKYDRATPETYR